VCKPQKKYPLRGLNHPITLLIFVASFLVVHAGCDGSRHSSYQLTILHTNDIHGQFVPITTVSGNDTIVTGGFEALSQYVREERRKAERVLLVDAGLCGSYHKSFDWRM